MVNASLSTRRVVARRVSGPVLYQIRCSNYYTHLPPPPPKEYLPDGSPKKYPLHQYVYTHGWNWEKWGLKPAGVFHVVMEGEFGRTYKAKHGFMFSAPLYVSVPLVVGGCFTLVHLFYMSQAAGGKPKRFTPEWVSAQKERERCENTDPITRYLDRRRAERGNHFVLSNVLPQHPHFLFMGDAHDYEAAEYLLARRAKEAELREELAANTAPPENATGANN